MKNLKRVLSLGLASVMLLGMMVVGASAKDYTDAEDIVNAEAVQVMSALNIINGKEDGSYFAPKDLVTRAEMAKMIAVAMNGGSEANTGVKGTPTFTDIGGTWAEGWIEYCADMKIINGRGDGTFDPTGNVTGVEALKMVLTAMGYDAEAYHLQGAAWASQTLERARQTNPIKLTDRLDDVTMTEPATRDVAAQMIWNGLQSYVVTNSPSQNTNNGEVTWKWDEDKTTTLLKQRYDANVWTGTFDGNWNTSAASLKGEIAVSGTYTKYVGNVATPTPFDVDFPYDFDIDNIGEEVKVVWKDGVRSTTKNVLDNKDVVYGVFNTGATRVVRSQLSKIKENDNATDKVLNVDGTKYDALEDVEYYVNFKKVNPDKKSAGKQNTPNSLGQVLKKNSGYPVKVTFDEATGKVNKVYVTETYIGMVSSINSTNVSVVGNTGVSCNLKIADHDIEDGLEKNDIVTVTPLYNTNPNADDDKMVVVVKKAEKVSGELVSGKDNETLTLDDGKDYKISYQNGEKSGNGGERVAHYLLKGTSVNYPTDLGDIIDDFPFEDNDNLIGEDFDLYLVDGYVMAAVQTSESANNYSVILEVKGTADEAGATFGGLQLQVMGADGTKEIITVDKKSTNDGTRNPGDNKITSADYGVGDIITYTFNNDDEAKVTVEGTLTNAKQVKYDDKAKTVEYTNKSNVVVKQPTTADCVFYAQTEANAGLAVNEKKNTKAEWKAYNIRNLDDFDKTVLYTVVANNDGKVVAVAMDFKGKPSGASDDTVWGIISKYVKRQEDFWVYNVQANGEEYTIKVETSGKSSPVLKERDLVTFNPTANDEYDLSDVCRMGIDSDAMEADEVWRRGFVKEYSARDNTLTVYNNMPDGPDLQGVFSYGKNALATTYAIDKDAQIIFVDQDAKTSEGVGAINGYSQMEGTKARANVGYVLDDKDVIQVLFVETSGKRDVEGKETPSIYPELGA